MGISAFLSSGDGYLGKLLELHKACRGPFQAPRERWAFFGNAAAFPKKAHVPSWNSKGYLTCFRKLQKFPQIPISTLKECSVSCHKSRRAPFSPPQIEMRVDCPASPGKECRRPCHTSRGGWYLLDTGGEPGGFVTIRKPLISPSTRDQA